MHGIAQEQHIENDNLKINTDNVIKSNKCDQCDFPSSQADSLEIHMKMHSGTIATNVTMPIPWQAI